MKKDRGEVIVVVEGGMVTGVYSDREALSVSVLDLDSDDPERQEEAEKGKATLEARVERGELKEIW